MKNTSHFATLFLAIAILLAGCRVLYDFKPIKQFDQKEYDKMITSVLDRDFKIKPIVSEYEQFDAYRMCIQDSLWQHQTAVMLPKISKSAIETVKTNLRENGAVNKAAIVLINTDKFYVMLK